MKRFLFLLGAIGIMAVIVGLGYFIRYRSGLNGSPPAPPPPQVTVSVPGAGQQATTTPAPPPLSPAQKFGLVANGPVTDYFVDAQNTLTVILSDGRVSRISGGGENALASGSISNLAHASFSADGKKILATFGSSGSFQSSVFDTTIQSWQPLAADVQSPAWAPTGERIAYLSRTQNSSSLTTLDLGDPRARPQTVLPLNLEDAVIEWIGQDNLIVSEKSSAYSTASIWGIDLKTKVVSSLVSERSGVAALWDRETRRGIVFSANTNKKGGYLSFIDERGRTIRQFSIATMPVKCAFRSTSVVTQDAKSTSTTSAKGAATTTAQPPAAPPPPPRYSLLCALPRDAQTFKTNPLPDAYEKRALFTEDDFYEIDLSSGNIVEVFADASRSLDATNLKLAGGKLFFVNRYDGKLYAIAP